MSDKLINKHGKLTALIVMLLPVLGYTIYSFFDPPTWVAIAIFIIVIVPLLKIVEEEVKQERPYSS